MDLYLGIMTGTSCDGTDIAIVDIPNLAKLKCLHFGSVPWDSGFHDRARNLAESRHWRASDQIGFEQDYTEVVIKAAEQVLAEASLDQPLRAVGFHGLTLAHYPPSSQQNPGTYQASNPYLLAQALQVPVVFDFRRADMALGGEGAPLAPFLDYHHFRSDAHGRVLLNLGGIANLTFLPRSCGRSDVRAFDCGPANMLSDALIRRFGPSAQRYDEQGSGARQGKLLEPLLKQLLEHPFFAMHGPKSTGREDFGESVMALFEQADAPLNDLLATAIELTVVTITQAITHMEAELGTTFGEVLASGGGVNNLFLVEQLSERLYPRQTTSTQACGMDPDAKEAVLMAALAYAYQQRIPGNFPGVTAARQETVLGAATA